LLHDEGQRFIHKRDVVFRRIGDQALLVPIKGGMGELGSIFTLSDVAASIWLLIEPTRSIQEIANAVTESFEVSREQALTDVTKFLQLLEQKNLIESFQTARNSESAQL